MDNKLDDQLQSILLTTEQKPEFSTLLKSYSLPVEDLYEEHLMLFKVIKNDTPIGCFALESIGTTGLLRSVALFPQYHHQGLGGYIIRIAMEQARSRGITDLYLFTTDKEDFFAKMGFAPIRKDRLPSAIGNTREFQELCPDSAISMRINLSES